MFTVQALVLDPLTGVDSPRISGQLWRTSRLYVAVGALGYTLRAVSSALTPIVIGRVIDAGIARGLTGAVGRELGLLGLLLFGFLIGFVITHAFQIRADIAVGFRCTASTHDRVTRIGQAVGRKHSTGEVVTTISSDPPRIGALFELLPEFIGALIAFLLITVIVIHQDVLIGLVIAIGAPLVALATTRVIGPLQRLQGAQRAELGKLSSLGTDTVTGLRVLRGIGGETEFARAYSAQSQRVRRAGNAIARLASWMDGLQAILPGLFTVAVVYLGSRAALAGHMTPGEVAALFGVTTYLSLPLTIILITLMRLGFARVGIQRMSTIVATEPDAGEIAERLDDPGAPPATNTPRASRYGSADPRLAGPLIDSRTGVTIRPGLLTAIVSADPASSAAVLARLARLSDAEAGRVGDHRLTDIALARVRENILLCDATTELFGGKLRSVIDPWGGHPINFPDLERAVERARSGRSRRLIAPFAPEKEPADRDELIMSALLDADGADILESTGGLDGPVTEKGRSLSGGQRQRAGLARALLANPPILLLVDPTSALDSHTEDRIIARLKKRRKGRTTVCSTTSPLMLARMDEIIVLGEDETVIARGTHAQLLTAARHGDVPAATYARIIARFGGER